MNLENLAFTGDEEVVGGVNHTEVYLIDRKKLTTISEPPTLDAAADLAEAATIAAAHVPEANLGFLKLQVIPKTGNVESVLAGEDDGKVYNNSFTFSVKGSSATALGLARAAKNKDLIALVKEIGGQIRQIGGKEIPARLSEATATLGGGAHDGRKMITFVISDTQGYPAPIYNAAIPLPA